MFRSFARLARSTGRTWEQCVKAARVAVAAALAGGVLGGIACGADAIQPLPIGTQRQIFVDDYVIASRENLERAFHSPQRHPDNPILVGDRPWESWVIEVNGHPIVYDDQVGELRMYYVAPEMDPSAPAGERFRTCLGISKDGLHWERPNLGQVEWEGSKANNLLRSGKNWIRRPNVILDPADPDPERRYKMTYVDVIDGKSAIAKAHSCDGIVWKMNADGKPWFRRLHNSNLLGWDPNIDKYVIYPRMAGSGNSIGRSTSPDFVTWTEPELVIEPGPDDMGVNFKGNAAFLYEGLYLGFLWAFDHNKTAESELVYSRDGIEWTRVSPRHYYFPRGRPGAWDSEMILPVAPVVFDNKIWIYYAGWNLPYSQAALTRAHKGWFENGQRMQRAIGVATLRLDGFASLDAASAEGVVVTKPLRYPGGALVVNADVREELRVELLDESGQVLPSYGLDDCRPVRSDSTHHEIQWKGGAGLGRLAGEAVRLRFLLRHASLYSFGFAGPE